MMPIEAQANTQLNSTAPSQYKEMKEVIELLPNRDEVCLLIKEAFSKQFCEEVIKTHKQGFQAAISHYPTSYRNNERQLKDDLRFANSLFSEIKKYVPLILDIEGISKEESGTWNLLELNDRIRICRYLPNQYFNKHLDGVYYKSKLIQSKLTFMIYLNDSDEFSGGRTLFFDSKESDEIIGNYQPAKGDLMIFDHNLWHSGEQVLAGEKYILRSDILYKKIKSKKESASVPFGEGHLGYIWKIIKHKGNILTCGRDKKIKIWSENGDLLQELEGHENSILSLIITNKDRLISCSRDQSIRFWEKGPDGYKLEKVIHLEGGTILDLCELEDSRFGSCSADGRIRVLDKKGNILYSILAHDGWIWSIKQLEKGVIASIGEDGFLKIWSLPSGQLLSEKQYHFPITALAVLSKDRSLYLGGMNGILLHLRYDEDFNLSEIGSVKAHSDKIRCIKINDQLIASGGEDNRVIIYSKEDMIKQSEQLHKNFVQDILLEEDYLTSVSYDGQIKVHHKPYH